MSCYGPHLEMSRTWLKEALQWVPGSTVPIQLWSRARTAGLQQDVSALCQGGLLKSLLPLSLAWPILSCSRRSLIVSFCLSYAQRIKEGNQRWQRCQNTHTMLCSCVLSLFPPSRCFKPEQWPSLISFHQKPVTLSDGIWIELLSTSYCLLS